MQRYYEAEVADGLAFIAQEEIEDQFGKNVAFKKTRRSDTLTFVYSGDVQQLLNLKTVISVYSVQSFDIPRPKALLGHQNFQRLLEQINHVFLATDRDHYETLYLNAAGSGSSVMARIKKALAQHTGLTNDEVEGDLLIRIRKTPGKNNSWDVLIRLTPRPLATREWRICNMEGALNASVAQAMIHLLGVNSSDTFLNIVCGSGTIMIECLDYINAQRVIGCDIDWNVLQCAKENIHASADRSAQLLQNDAIRLSMADCSIDKLAADLPFGQLVGSHDENIELYPVLLQEAARVAKHGARFAVITHEMQLMRHILSKQGDWHLQQEIKITLSGLHPRIFVLERL